MQNEFTARSVARVCGIAVALIVALPGVAFAHGEQLLVYPTATIVLLFLSGIAALLWRECRRLKAVLAVTLFGVHAALWFLPITVAELADAMGRMFLVLVLVPLAVGVLVYVLVRRGRRRGALSAPPD